jgi:hypothetical protein
MAYPPWKFLVIGCNSKILPDMPFFLFQLFSSYTTFENNSGGAELRLAEKGLAEQVLMC